MDGRSGSVDRLTSACDDVDIRRADLGQPAANTISITVRHNFETAHRLPHIGGKCHNLHGHSWWVEITVSGEAGPDGIVVEFRDLKCHLRDWVDVHLDHGAMLGRADELVSALKAAESKVFVFGESEPSFGLDWPTVENVAELLARVTDECLRSGGRRDVRVSRVAVQETHINAAEISRR